MITQKLVPGRRPDVYIPGQTIHAYILRYWYLVPLIKFPGLPLYYLPPTRYPRMEWAIPCPGHRASSYFGRYLFFAKLRIGGWVGLGGSGYISKWYARPKTVTHPSTSRPRRRVTSSIRQTPLPLRQTATNGNTRIHPSRSITTK